MDRPESALSREPLFDFAATRPAPPLDAFVGAIWAVRGSSIYRRAGSRASRR